MSKKVLFILKKRPKGAYGTWSYTTDDVETLDSGLIVSARQMHEMLLDKGVESNLVQVVDNNEIDKWVTKYRPDYVIIEAFWVVPEKFDILKKLHPTVQWIVRCHSKLDFLAYEGLAIGWALDYLGKDVRVACNSRDATDDLKELAISLGSNPELVIYLPNYYKTKNSKKLLQPIVQKWRSSSTRYIPKIPGQLNIGCFGSIRPLKNNFIQAIAAINAAEYLNLDLRFHISSNRIEGKADALLKAMRVLFSKYEKHKLVELPWSPHSEFVAYVGTMDINMQVSLSETFNIVCADSVNSGVPVVVSDQMPWLDSRYQVSAPNNVQEITSVLIEVYNKMGTNILIADQHLQLEKYCEEVSNIWLTYIK